MTAGFKKFLIFTVAIFIGYGFSYLINESPLEISYNKAYPQCTLDCGAEFTDYYSHYTKVGIPFTYRSTTITKNGEELANYSAKENNLLFDHLFFIVLAELAAAAYVIKKSRLRKI
jgi:hypothetical protein